MLINFNKIVIRLLLSRDCDTIKERINKIIRVSAAATSNRHIAMPRSLALKILCSLRRAVSSKSTPWLSPSTYSSPLVSAQFHLHIHPRQCSYCAERLDRNARFPFQLVICARTTFSSLSTNTHTYIIIYHIHLLDYSPLQPTHVFFFFFVCVLCSYKKS